MRALVPSFILYNFLIKIICFNIIINISFFSLKSLLNFLLCRYPIPNP